MVAFHIDPADAWLALKNAFQAGDQSQILTLTGQLQTMRLTEGGSIEDYIKKARGTKNRLVSMGKTIGDKSLTQLLLNGLPRSYESTIQTLMHINVPMTFEQVAASLLSESHRREQRSAQLGEEEALSATIGRGRGASPYFSNRGAHIRGRSPFRGFRGYPPLAFQYSNRPP
jgi:hypothetical protein